MRDRRSLYWPLAVAAAVHLALAGWYLVKTGGNTSFFVHFGAGHPVSAAYGGAAAGLWLHAGAYDGIAYYTIARSPFAIDELSRLLDTPRYRYRRIVYPLAAAVLSLGRVELVSLGLLLANFFAMILGGYWLIRLLAADNVASAWSLLYLLHPALLTSFLLDLPTAVVSAAVIFALWSYRRNFLSGVAVGLSLAVLTWEGLGLPATIGLALADVVTRRTWRVRWPLLVPLGVMLGWQAVVYRLFAGPLVLTEKVASVFGYPGVGWWRALRTAVLAPLGAGTPAQVLLLLCLAALGVTAVMRALTRRGPFDAAAAVQAFFIAGFTVPNLILPVELTRKTIGLWLFAFLGFAQHRDRWTMALLLGVAAATLLLGPWLPTVALPR